MECTLPGYNFGPPEGLNPHWGTSVTDLDVRVQIPPPPDEGDNQGLQSEDMELSLHNLPLRSQEVNDAPKAESRCWPKMSPPRFAPTSFEKQTAVTLQKVQQNPDIGKGASTTKDQKTAILSNIPS